jgi:hypothetical protein
VIIFTLSKLLKASSTTSMSSMANLVTQLNLYSSAPMTPSSFRSTILKLESMNIFMAWGKSSYRRPMQHCCTACLNSSVVIFPSCKSSCVRNKQRRIHIGCLWSGSKPFNLTTRRSEKTYSNLLSERGCVEICAWRERLLKKLANYLEAKPY